MDSGLRVSGFGFRFGVLGFRLCSSGLMVVGVEIRQLRVKCVGLGGLGSGMRVLDLRSNVCSGFGVKVVRFTVCSSGFGVQGLGRRVQGVRFRGLGLRLGVGSLELTV